MHDLATVVYDWKIRENRKIVLMYRSGSIPLCSQSLLARINTPHSDYLNFWIYSLPHTAQGLNQSRDLLSLSHMQELKARELNAHVQDCKYGHAAKNRNWTETFLGLHCKETHTPWASGIYICWSSNTVWLCLHRAEPRWAGSAFWLGSKSEAWWHMTCICPGF